MAYYTPIISAHLKEKHHWSEDTFLSIDWSALDKEYKRLSTGCWLAAFKLQNGSGQHNMCSISTNQPSLLPAQGVILVQRHTTMFCVAPNLKPHDSSSGAKLRHYSSLHSIPPTPSTMPLSME